MYEEKEDTRGQVKMIVDSLLLSLANQSVPF